MSLTNGLQHKSILDVSLRIRLLSYLLTLMGYVFTPTISL